MAISGQVPVKRASAKRCLFGPPDHERIRRDLDRALSEMDRSTKASLKSKWGFDVDSESGVPEGRFEYTEVRNSEYVPNFYRKGYRTRTKRVTPREPRVDASTQIDFTSVSTVTSSSPAGHETDSPLTSAATPRTIVTGVRRLDFKENCDKPSATTTQRSRNSRSTSSSPMHQSTMTEFFPGRKRRSPDCENSLLHRGKSPRL